jgi:hypothetical protein
MLTPTGPRRLLAYAGFDARAAVQFWEDREATDTCGDTQKKPNPTTAAPSSEPYALDRIAEWLPFKWTSREGEGAGTWFTKQTASEAGGHPISAERVSRLRAELKRWEEAREKYAKLLRDTDAGRLVEA